MDRKMSNGEALVYTIITIFVILLVAGVFEDATSPKCISSGCNNDQAEGSSYCYMHKLYRNSYSSGSKSSSSGTSTKSSGSAGSSTKSSSSSTKSTSTTKSAKKTTTKKKNSSSSKKKSNPYDSYDEGYEDVYENDDYDWDRYYSDDDYADGVDDAMDELDW